MAIGAAPAVGATTESEKSLEDHIQQSHEMLEGGASLEERETYLENENITSDKSQQTFKIQREDSVSPQSFDSDELDITAYLWHSCDDGEYYAELVWDYEWDVGSYGAPPNDRVGIGFNSEWWDYSSYSISDTTETSNLVTPNESEFGSGPAFLVNDDDVPDENNQYWAGVYLDAVGDYTEDERRIQGGYSHLWEGVSVDSVSVSYPVGVSVSVSDHTYEWTTPTEQDGDTLLRLSQADSVYCS